MANGGGRPLDESERVFRILHATEVDSRLTWLPPTARAGHPPNDAARWIIRTLAGVPVGILDDTTFRGMYVPDNPVSAAGEPRSGLVEVDELGTAHLAVILARSPLTPMGWQEDTLRLGPLHNPHPLVVLRGGAGHIHGWWQQPTPPGEATVSVDDELATIITVNERIAATQGKVVLAIGNDSTDAWDGKNPRQRVQAAHAHLLYVDADRLELSESPETPALATFVRGLGELENGGADWMSVESWADLRAARQAFLRSAPDGVPAAVPFDERGDYCWIQVPADRQWGRLAGRLVVMRPLGPTQDRLVCALAGALGLKPEVSPSLAYSRSGREIAQDGWAPVHDIEHAGATRNAPPRDDPAFRSVVADVLVAQPDLVEALAQPSATVAQRVHAGVAAEAAYRAQVDALVGAELRAGRPQPREASEREIATAMKDAPALRKRAVVVPFGGHDLSVNAGGKPLAAKDGVVGLSGLIDSSGRLVLTTVSLWTREKFEAAHAPAVNGHEVTDIVLPQGSRLLGADESNPRRVVFDSVTNGARSLTTFPLLDDQAEFTDGRPPTLKLSTPVRVAERQTLVKLALYRGREPLVVRTSEGPVLVRNGFIAITVDADGRPARGPDGRFDIYAPGDELLQNYARVHGSTVLTSLPVLDSLDGSVHDEHVEADLRNAPLYRSHAPKLISEPQTAARILVKQGVAHTPDGTLMARPILLDRAAKGGYRETGEDASPLDPVVARTQYRIVERPPAGVQVPPGWHYAVRVGLTASALYVGPPTRLLTRFGLEELTPGARIAMHVSAEPPHNPLTWTDADGVQHLDQYPIAGVARRADGSPVLDQSGKPMSEVDVLDFRREWLPSVLGRIPVLTSLDGGVEWRWHRDVVELLRRRGVAVDGRAARAGTTGVTLDHADVPPWQRRPHEAPRTVVAEAMVVG